MSNPYHRAVDNALRMQPVVAITEDGRYEGVLERRDHHSGDVLLRGATFYASATGSGEQVGATRVQDPMVLHQQDSELVRRLNPGNLQPSPYHHREFEPAENQRYIRQVREQGHVDSIITAYRTSQHDPFVVVAGHKRRWVALEAGVDRLPVEIVDYSDWQAAWAYADDHLHALDEDVLEATLEVYASEWGERAHDIPVVDETAQEAGVALTSEGLEALDEPEPKPAGHVADVSGAVDVVDEPDDDPVEDDLEESDAALEDDVVERSDELLAVEIDGEPVGLPLDHTDEEHLAWAFERESSMMAASEYFAVSYGTVRDRFIDAGLHRPVGSPAQSGVDADDGEADETEEEEEDTEVWCGVCDEGPFDSRQQLSGHHAGAGHDGELQPVDEPPEVDESSYPRTCDDCDVELGDSLEEAVHRTEAHGQTRSELGWLEPGEFEEIVEEADSLGDIMAATEWSMERVMRALGVYGLDDVVGPSDVELSNLTDWGFEGIDSTDVPETSDPEPSEPVVATDGEGTPAYVEHDIDPNDLVDALDGATSGTDVARQLGMADRQAVGTILEELGLFEDLSGTGSLDRRTAERAVKEVAARAE